MRTLLFFFPLSLFAAKVCYDVRIVGLSDKEATQALYDRSELVSLQDRPPASLYALRFRAEGDRANLLQVLKAYAYFDAEVNFDIERTEGPLTHVTIAVTPGPQYTLYSYAIVEDKTKEPLDIPCCTPIALDRLGVLPGTPALSTTIVNAELALLEELARCGHPLATIEHRRIVVDMQSKEVEAAVALNEGPEAKFGPTTLFGLKEVEPRFIERKISWREGETYTEDQVEETTDRLLKSDLFSSVLVSHTDKLDEKGELPMKLRVSEAKHRSVNFGLSYGTVDGVGGSVSWTHRNVRHMGEFFSFQAEASERYYAGLITYKKPDFMRFNQSFALNGDVSYLAIKPYHAQDYLASAILERILDEEDTFSVGLQGEYIKVRHSANDGNYWLGGLPLFFKHTTANAELDPTRGYTLTYAVIPFQSFQTAHVHFVKQRLNLNLYFPLAGKWVVLALRGQAGSIAGARQHAIPMPKLFFGGSEDDLRGYRYQTVSPLDARGQPLGGRSALFSTAEFRFRLTRTFGLVAFGDFGTVTFNEVPTANAKWFKSVGGGIRYYTYFGPLRLDVGVPLDRRRPIDPPFQVYVNIGQTF